MGKWHYSTILRMARPLGVLVPFALRVASAFLNTSALLLK